MKKYNHIFFDLDHTLWDFERNSGETLRELYEDFHLSGRGIAGFEEFRQTYEFHNEKFWDRYRKGFISRKDLRWKRMWHTLLDFKIGDMALTEQLSKLYLERLPNKAGLMPYAIEVLNYCRDKNYNIHIITNGFETTQWQKMRNSGIDHYFKHVITSENSNSMKPQPGIFQFALQKANATAGESIMIGDSIEADILGALQYGIDQVFFNPSGREHDYLFTYEINCLSKIRKLL